MKLSGMNGEKEILEEERAWVEKNSKRVKEAEVERRV